MSASITGAMAWSSNETLGMKSTACSSRRWARISLMTRYMEERVL